MKFKNVINRAVCLTLTASIVLVSGCAQVQSLIDGAKNAFVLDPGDDYNAQDDLDKMMAELEMAKPPSAGKLHPVNVMDNESFNVGWDSVKDVFEYAVEIKINGVTRESYTTTDTKIEISPANAGGEVAVSVIARRKMEPIQGDAYVIESPALNITVGVYSIKAVENMMDYYSALKEIIEKGIVESYEKPDPHLFHKLSLIPRFKILTIIKELTFRECQINLIEQAKQANIESLKYAEYFCAWYDAIKSNPQQQKLDAVAVESLRDCLVYYFAYGQTSTALLNSAIDTKLDNKDLFNENMTVEASVIFVLKLSQAMISMAQIGLYTGYITIALPLNISTAIQLIDDTVSVQLEFNNRIKKINEFFDTSCNNYMSDFTKALKS